jgi:RNA recognition motif-containing protein
MDATNVFIKYLPTDLTNTGLFTLFSQFGEITSCKVMVDPITGFSLGYGYALRPSLPFH